MAKKTIPDDMKQTMDNKILMSRYIDWPVVQRCRFIYNKVMHNGWPVDRSCALMDVSTTWYRNRAMRFSDLWDAEHQETIDADQKYQKFLDRASKIMHVDFNHDANADRLYDILYSIDEYKMQEEEGVLDYTNVPDSVLIEAVRIFGLDTVPDDFIHTADTLVCESIQGFKNTQTSKENTATAS